MLSAFAHVSRGLERFLVAICYTLLVGLSVLVMTAVVLRKIGMPLGWYDEVATIMLAWLTYYGAALATLYRAHLGFPGLVAVCPPPLRVALIIIGDVLTIGFFALVAYFGFQVIQILEGDYLVSIRWVPISFTQSVIPIGACLFILAQILTLPARLAEARSGAPVFDAEQHLADPALNDPEPAPKETSAANDGHAKREALR